MTTMCLVKLLLLLVLLIVVAVAADPSDVTTERQTLQSHHTHKTRLRDGSTLQQLSEFDTQTAHDPYFAADVVLPSSAHSYFDGRTTTTPPSSSSRTLSTSQQAQLRCFIQQDNSLACALPDTPRKGLILVFFQCPPSSETLLDCETCHVFEASNVQEIGAVGTANLPTCTACRICVEQSSVSYDCSNQDPNEPCAKVDCSATCLNTDEDLVNPGLEDLTPVEEEEDQGETSSASAVSRTVRVMAVAVSMLSMGMTVEVGWGVV